MKIALMILTTLAVVALAVSLSLGAHNWWIGGLLLGAYIVARLFDWRRSKARSDEKSGP